MKEDKRLSLKERIIIQTLLEEKSSWVTGAVWDIDAGVMAGRN